MLDAASAPSRVNNPIGMPSAPHPWADEQGR